MNAPVSSTVFSETLEIVLSLEKLLKSCFGPQGLSVLVETSDGQASSMHNALQLVKSLQYTSLSGSKLVLEAIEKLYTNTGDGGKKFIFMVEAAFQEVLHHCHGNSMTLKGYGLALAKLRQDLFLTAIPAATTSQAAVERGVCQVLEETTSGSAVKELVSDLAQSVIRRSLPSSVRNTLLDVILTLLFPPAVDHSLHFLQQVQWLLKNFVEVVQKIPGVPCQESRALPGFILDRNFTVPPSGTLKSFRCVLLMCNFSRHSVEDSNNGGIAYQVLLQDDLSKIRSSSIALKENIVQALVDREIELVLAAYKLDKVSSHCLRTNSIAAIQMVSEETLRHMAESCGTFPVTEVRDLVRINHTRMSVIHIELASIPGKSQPPLAPLTTRGDLGVEPKQDGALGAINSNPVISRSSPTGETQLENGYSEASQRDTTDNGTRNYCTSQTPPLYGQGSHSTSKQGLGFCPFSVVLCGVTAGQCRHLASQLLQALKAIASWTSHKDERGRHVALRGGGVWEVSVARELERRLRYAGLIKGSDDWVICKALQKAFLATPLCLLETSSSCADHARNIEQLLGNSALESDIPVAVDTDQGVLVALSPDLSLTVWEPYWSQYPMKYILLVSSTLTDILLNRMVIVNCVCDCLMKCLRIDGVIKTSKHLSSLKKPIDEDNE